MKIRIKICGIKSPEQAITACEAGADAIGMIFYPPSPRHVEIETGTVISKSVRPLVNKVAVMVNPQVDYVKEIIDHVQPQLLQFQGVEDAPFCRQFGLPYIKALRVTDDSNLASQEKAYPDASGILLDSYSTDGYGGSGKKFDWGKADYARTKAIILAGGLTPNNVIQAIQEVRPWAVDVSSGVEVDGVKSKALMAAFCTKVAQFNCKNIH